MAAILKIKNERGEWEEVTALVGTTPKRGIDYWTEQDKEDIIVEVLARIPDGDEVSY